ncbi:MAG TPA: cbb3-type cytochrome c oxidase subunit II [Acidobacteriaceae bacterium]|nr:cbb3-type cytochrome c oxidase subunit II [Acidobacteriaceae bacterium]
MSHITAVTPKREYICGRVRMAVAMMKIWIERVAILGCAVVAFSSAPGMAQSPEEPLSQQSSRTLTLEGLAIQTLVTMPLDKREVRKLVTNSRTAQEHPNLAAYYRAEAQRLEIESEKYERLARAAGDPLPVSAPNHFNIDRTARFNYIVAKESLRRAQEDKILAALHGQAQNREGCFACHRLNGQGGKTGPDLALEGTRGRSDAWLIGHFKDPQTLTPSSVMPAFSSFTDRQLEVLTTYLQSQRGK